jgi:glycosyltransferase involved in cell wall biosynthesis
MLTVLLATRNRAPILRDVLEAHCLLEAPPLGWKLVVVDNGSTDDTPQVFASFTNRLPLKWVVEPKIGKNFALNAGLEFLDGDLTVLTDDDAFPQRDWLVRLRGAADAHPQYSIFGGAVLPRWAACPPSWIDWLDQAAAFTITDQSLTEGPVDAHHVFGPNMAIRSCVFQSGMRFDPSIGPRGSSYPMGSETELALRLSREGHKAWYVAQAVVEHFVREEQLKRAWLFQRAIRLGRGQYRLYGPNNADHARLWMGIPRYLFRKMLKQAVLTVTASLALRHEAAFRAHWRFNFFWGQALEASALAQQERLQRRTAGGSLSRHP